MLGNGSDSERLPFVLKKLEQTEAFVIELQDELAELRADLEFAVDHGINIYVHEPGFVTIYYGDGMDSLTYEGTPEGIFRVIRAARKGE